MLLPSNKIKSFRIHLALNSGGMSRNGLEVDNKSGLESKNKFQLVNLKAVGGIMSLLS